MAKDILRYDLMVQDALKGVVKRILVEAGRDGLPGEHHFYITFRTGAPGVRMSQRLREKHPEEMTIVLQHQFWDLAVSDHAFEVGLSFSGVPERLLVPFDAIATFFDPSVQFGLKFELQDAAEPAQEPETPKPRGPAAEAEIAPLPVAKLKPAALPVPRAAEDAKPPAKEAKSGGKDAKVPAKDPAAQGEDDDKGAEVVSLDAFRKKT